MPLYEVIDRVSKDHYRMAASSAQEACERLGLMIGNCYVQRVPDGPSALRFWSYADLCLLEEQTQRDGDDMTHRYVVAELARRRDDARPPDTPEHTGRGRMFAL